MHEVGHTLGLWHENQRPDRDSFIKILNDKNIYINRLALVPIDLTVPYNLNSLMHDRPKVRDSQLLLTGYLVA